MIIGNGEDKYCDFLKNSTIQNTAEGKIMLRDKLFYNTCKENLKQAKKELCWENERIKLEKAFIEKIIA